MKKITSLFLLSFFLSNPSMAQEKKPVKVLLLGTFHFANPGLDVSKFDDANILSDKRQQEVLAIIQKLKAYRPDKIFVEVAPTLQHKLDSAVMNYKNGKLVLGSSETHQLGYRLAKELNLPMVYGIDYQETDFPFDSLMKTAVAS